MPNPDNPNPETTGPSEPNPANTGQSNTAPGNTAADTATAEEPAERPNRRKVREGLVKSVSMDKTAIVVFTDRVRHRRYNKTVPRHTRLYVHDETNQLSVGDRVRVQETRPLSKSKRWRLLEIVERAR